MIPYLLNGNAVRGVVASVNETRFQGPVNMVRRAVIALDTDEPAAMPMGKELWWTATAAGRPWAVQAVRPQGPGSRITLMLRDVPPRPAGCRRVSASPCPRCTRPERVPPAAPADSALDSPPGGLAALTGTYPRRRQPAAAGTPLTAPP